jgi:hypothetical protein
MFKHANRGALPAMLVLGVLIGASLAVASPSRPNRVLPSASPPVVAAPQGTGEEGAAAGSEGTATEPHACAHAIAALAHGDHGLSHAIARVLSNCKENPQAPGLVNALLHRPGTAGKGGGKSSHAGGAEGSGRPGGGASAGSGGSEGSGSGGPGGGESGGSGSGGSGSTDAGKDNNGKAKGHYDGKGKNG